MIEKIKQFYLDRGYIFNGKIVQRENSIVLYGVNNVHPICTISGQFDTEKEFEDYIFKELNKRRLEETKYFTGTQATKIYD